MNIVNGLAKDTAFALEKILKHLRQQVFKNNTSNFDMQSGQGVTIFCSSLSILRGRPLEK
jgi:hypothetical protein